MPTPSRECRADEWGMMSLRTLVEWCKFSLDTGEFPASRILFLLSCVWLIRVVPVIAILRQRPRFLPITPLLVTQVVARISIYNLPIGWRLLNSYEANRVVARSRG